jgi:hypothetical protein
LWAGNTTTSVHTLCEICMPCCLFPFTRTHHRLSAIRVAMAVSVGLPASSMVINRRLYTLACMPPTVEATKSNVRGFLCVFLLS